MKQNIKLSSYWPLFFILLSLEAVAGFIFLLLIPSEGTRLVLGYSAARWAILLPMLLFAGSFAVAAYSTYRSPTLRSTWLDPETRPQLFQWPAIGFAFLAAMTSIIAFLLRWLDPKNLLPYYERAWPLLIFLILASAQSALWLATLQYGFRKRAFDALKPAIVAFIILLFVYVFISVTKLGLTPDKAYWGEPGVPVLGWQFLFVLLCSGLILMISLLPVFERWRSQTELFTLLFIYGLALSLWLSVPNEVLRNSFYFPIDPPANTPFPYSDSGYYDYMAHSLLIGTDYTGEIPTRPLYIVFLTVLHLLFGERYDLIIIGQTCVLAIFPVILYILGKKIHSRIAGFTIALLAIAREWTNLLVSSDTRVSNTKTLLVDMPTLLLILLACVFAFRWLERKDRMGAFIAGGVFGILSLLRTQALLILPFLILLAFLSLRAQKEPWLVKFMVFGLGMLLSILPWLTHNYLQVGRLTFDAPFQLKVLASQYAYTGNLDFSNVNLEGKGLVGILVTFALKDPGFVAGFIGNHSLATEVGSLLALPLVEPFNGLSAPINLYWTFFDGQLAWYNHALLMGYLVLIAIGLGSAWRRWRWIGLLPLAFNLGYALANGIGRFSGWRYDLPADWIAYFYFAIGFVELLTWLALAFGAQQERLYSTVTSHTRNREQPLQAWIAFAFLFIFIGSAPWFVKAISSHRYPDKTAETIKAELRSYPGTKGMAEEMGSFLNQTDAIVLEGRVLYPRFFWRNSGLTSATPWQSYAPRAYPRLGFLLIDQSVSEVVLPLKGSEIENIHAKTIQLLGCQRKSYIEARLVVVPQENLVYLSNFGFEPCSP